MTSTAAKKGNYHHGDLANALLDAVAGIVSEKGVSGVSLREAARRAGVSHSAPAHHFGDKEGLLSALAEQGFGHLASAMISAVAAAQDETDLDQMKAMGKAYVKFAAEYPAHFDVMFRSGLNKSAHETLHNAADATFMVLQSKTEDLVTKGMFPGVDPRDLAVFFWSLVHGLASLWVDGSIPQVVADKTLDELIEAALISVLGFAEDLWT
ncbi:MAG: TetR/AcrR family transcriptional regulator [Actinomycetota bacterium]|nr:TetR/AcrR family transcriptional regulator [Actinomycetota bacterium]